MSRRILITPKSFATYRDAVYPRIEAQGYEIVENTLGRTMTEPELIAAAREGVVGIIVGVDPLSAAVLESCRDLRAVSKYGMGMDNIDLDRARELGIRVTNAAGTNHVSVAEQTIGLLFAIARHIPRAVADVKRGEWGRTLGTELAGKRIGLVGGGQIGREVAVRAIGLGMAVSLYDPYLRDETFLRQYGIRRCGSLEELLAEADVVSLHVPYTPETRHLINRETLALLKPGALLVNTSRGELVDEDALYDALTAGRLAGAAQDVFSEEPPPADHPLLRLDRFILTPHAGAYTAEAVRRMAETSARNLLDLLDEQGEC